MIADLSSPNQQSLSPEEQRLFRLYGKLPSGKDRFTKNKLTERKYFDSGDYALNKAGKGDGMDTGQVGSEHPDPENIRHVAVSPGASGAAATAAPPPASGVGGVVPSLNKSVSSGVGGVGGHQHPSGSIPVGGSPAKESGLQRETSAEEAVEDEEAADGSTDPQQQGIPIRS